MIIDRSSNHRFLNVRLKRIELKQVVFELVTGVSLLALLIGFTWYFIWVM